MPTVSIEVFKCCRCGYVWKSIKEKPIRCARCRSPYWDREKQDGRTE